MMLESRKILGLPQLPVSATCVRVPVVRAHSVAISAEFERPVSVEEARQAVREFPGAELVDDPAHGEYPTPLDFSRQARVRSGPDPPRHGACQWPLVLGQRRQSLEGRRPECRAECRAYDSRGQDRAEGGPRGCLTDTDA